MEKNQGRDNIERAFWGGPRLRRWPGLPVVVWGVITMSEFEFRQDPSRKHLVLPSIPTCTTELDSM